LCNWTNDVKRLLLEHFDTIHNSPSQIYHSALPLCPSSSWLCKCYSAELEEEVKAVRGLSAEWGACSRTVPLAHDAMAISHWNNVVAVGLLSGDIIILSAITGSQSTTLSGHSNLVVSVTFSSDGVLLVSGSYDKTIKLWDIQTGGIITTFSGHNDYVLSVSISTDSAMVASGSSDKTIRLWDIQTRKCRWVIEQQNCAYTVYLLPAHPQILITSSGDTLQQWDINGQKIGPEDTGILIAVSQDGSQFALYNDSAVTVQNTTSRAITARFHVASYFNCGCFSPDGRLIAVGVYNTAYVWDITSSDPLLVETFIGHSDDIYGLAFSSPSSLISASWDRSVKFWQIGTLLVDSVETGSKSITSNLAQVMSVTLQGTEGIVITSHSDGIVRIWDILTGHCNRSLQTPLQDDHYHRDAQVIDGRLIIVWCKEGKEGKEWEEGQINIWDAENQQLLSAKLGSIVLRNLKISGDGSKVFLQDNDCITLWSIQTGENIGRVESKLIHPASLIVEGSRVWGHCLQSYWTEWDFEHPDSPIELGLEPPSKLHPGGTILWNFGLSRIQDTTSGKVLFQLSTGVEKPADVCWKDQYFVACFKSGKVLVLDFSCILLQ
jgi:WD40 repeat protein